jgi:hypothetical protein
VPGKQIKRKPAKPATPAGPSLGARISGWFAETFKKKAPPPKSKSQKTDRLTPS